MGCSRFLRPYFYALICVIGHLKSHILSAVGALKVSAAKLNTVLPQELVKHGLFDSVELRNASHVAGLGPHGALLCVTSASLITVTRNDPDVDKLFIPVVVCHDT